ncbi:helix-turn-helix transcriptional regulator [Thiolapillus sp.]|uniref:helix-turn-helix transcriptional regulator n=1 Tax=Thiolapillus sp. TaxID=2017437 RepID=UPI003AF70AC7
MNNEKQMLTITDIIKITTIKRTKLYELIKNGDFPKPNTTSKRKIWTASTVKEWMQQKAEERSK